MKALINGTEIMQISDVEFPVADPWFWVDCPDTITTTEYTYVNSQFVQKEFPSVGLSQEEIKDLIDTLLKESDFSALPDVNLQNKSDWLQYRQILRDNRINLPNTIVGLPVKPPVVWA